MQRASTETPETCQQLALFAWAEIRVPDSLISGLIRHHAHRRIFCWVVEKAYILIVASHLSIQRRQMKVATGECRVHNTIYNQGRCFAMA